jgi:lipoprotein signal peptidase
MIATLGVVVAVDQATKMASATSSAESSGMSIPVRNSEFSLGLATAPWPAQLGLMVAGLVLAAAVLTVGVRRGAAPGWAAGLVVGGGLSNLIDRALLGSVRDFFPIGSVLLNAADLAVVVGLVVVLAAVRPSPSASAPRR